MSFSKVPLGLMSKPAVATEAGTKGTTLFSKVLLLLVVQPAVATEAGTKGIVSFSRVLLPLIVTGTYGVLVSLTSMNGHLGMTACTPQLPATPSH